MLALVGRFEHIIIIIIIIIIIKGIYIAQVRKGHKCAYAAVSSVLPPDESLWVKRLLASPIPGHYVQHDVIYKTGNT